MNDSPRSLRIARIQQRYQSGPARISVERARLYTVGWRETEGQGLPPTIRVATAMKRVYQGMTHHLDTDDRIAGHWTENFLGVPVDIERGVFNLVFEKELTLSSLARARARSAVGGLSYMLRRGGLMEFLRNQRVARSAGASPLNMSLQTMSDRRINPYQIDDDDRRELVGELLPWWRGRTLVDRLEEKLAGSDLYSQDMHEFVIALPGNTSRQVMLLSTCATISTIQGHVILDHRGVLEKGLTGMRAEVAEKLAAERDETGPTAVFLRSIELSLEGIEIFCHRLAERIEGELSRTTTRTRREPLERLLETCRRVPLRPARTFTEAVQALWTVKTAVELAHPVNLHCFGRLDQILAPYYRADLAAGRLEPAQARELLEELLLKVMSQNVRPESNLLANFYHRFLGSAPVTVGGLRPDGTDGTNEVTHLIVQAAFRSRAVTNISVRVNSQTPDALLQEVGSLLKQGASCFSLFNDEVNIEAMRRRGFAEADARDYAIMGCVEAISPGRTGAMSAGALLLSRLLDLTLRNGDSAMMAGTIRREGLPTGTADSFASFDDLLAAFCRQAAWFIEKLVAGSNVKDRLYEEHLPAPHISSFIEGCLENGRDVTAGGARYDLSGISMINSIANLVDSLVVIKRLVYEEGELTLAELLEAVDRNFEGREELLARIRRLQGKWGNGDPETDRLARQVMQGLLDETHRHRNHRGGPFVVYVISMITHTLDGRLSVAGPDGRAAASPFAASCNPYNVERAGVTAALRSVAALPFEEIMGCAVNVRLHPTALGETAETMAKWVSLVRTYFKLGGSQLQPTVVSTETLRAAQRDPDRHRELMVKVGGYSTYFVDLGPEIQEEVIARTEHC